MRSTAGKKKVKKIFKFEKVFKTCSKLIIRELGNCPTRSDDVWFANNEKVSLTVFTFAFCFMHAEHNLIKLELNNSWSAQAINSILESVLWNWKKPIKFAHL